MVRLPENVKQYAESQVFTEASVPKKLTSVHDTKAGVWGRLVVIEGELDFVIVGPPETTLHLNTQTTAIIQPQVPHFVSLKGPVKFKIEFLK